jgi:uncharacterized protein YndB with AHSA1/START domain
MPERIEAKVTHHFAASPERVYDAMTDPEQVRRWQRAWLIQGGLPGVVTHCEIDPQVGGKFLYADMRDGDEARHWGTFLALERPIKIAHTWIVDESEEDDPSVVTIIIEPAPVGNGTTVTLYNEMDAQWADYRERTERGWMAMLTAVDGLPSAQGAHP